MDTASLPAWAQAAGSIAIAILAAIIGVFKYLKTEPKEPISSGTVISASVIDSKLLKEVVETIRENQEDFEREVKRIIRATQDVRDAMQENTEAMVLQTDATTNLLRFINRNTPKSQRVVDVQENI